MVQILVRFCSLVLNCDKSRFMVLINLEVCVCCNFIGISYVVPSIEILHFYTSLK